MIRTVDPLEFEDLVFDTFEHHGYPTRRSPHFCGGEEEISGSVLIHGERHGIRCKCFEPGEKPVVDSQMLMRTARLLQCNGYKKGILIHTGHLAQATRQTILPIVLLSADRLPAWLQSRQRPTIPFPS